MLKGGVTFAQVQSQPGYAALSPEQQSEVADDFFVKHVASQQTFQSLAPEQQEEARQDFRVKYNVPDIEMAPAQAPRQAEYRTVEVPQIGDYNPWNPGNIAKDLAGATMSTAAGALKGASLGYADFTDDAQRAAQAFGANYYSPDIAAGGGELSGIMAPFGAASKLTGGLLQGSSILATMGREALAGAGIGALYKPEGEDLVNLPQRAANAVSWGVGGAALPLAGKVLQGGVKMLAQAPKAFRMDTRPISALSREQVEQQLQARIAESVQKQVMGRKLYQVRLQATASELQKLRAETGPVIQMQVDKKLAQLESGKVTPGELKRIEAFIKNAPRKGKVQKESPLVQKAKAKQQNRAATQNPETQPEGTPSQAKPEPKGQGQKVGGRVTTRQGIKAEAAQAAKTGELVEFDYSAEGGRSRLNEERIVREGTARDGRTEARQIGGEDLSKQQGYRKEVVVEVKVTQAGDTAMVTKNEAGEFRTRIIEGKGQGSRVNWIRRTGEMPGPEYGTKEAVSAGKMYSRDRLAQIQKALEAPDIPEPLRKTFARVMKNKKLTTADYTQLNKHADDPKVKQIICDILGLTHG